MMHLNLALKVASTSIKELWYINAMRLIVKVKPLLKIFPKILLILWVSNNWKLQKTKWSGINMCVRKTEAVSY